MPAVTRSLLLLLLTALPGVARTSESAAPTAAPAAFASGPLRLSLLPRPSARTPFASTFDSGAFENRLDGPGWNRSLVRPVLAARGSSQADFQDTEAPPTPRPLAVEYGDAYRIRLKIHKYASVASLPLFIAQFVVGQKLYGGHGSDTLRGAHSALAAGTGVLFGVNTITGVWNLAEGRKDPAHRRRRMIHGILMAVADAGFVATGALAPENESGEGGTSRSTHRAIALSSMGVATVAYLMMLIGD
jgi:hypothetical protein